MIFDMKNFRSILFAAALCLGVTVEASCQGVTTEAGDKPVTIPAREKQWRLVFEDNFDSNAVDRSSWSMYNGPGHGGNGRRDPAAYSVSDGLLVITAQMKDYGDGKGPQISSGGMAHRENYLYGRFEFRVRCEADPSGATSGVVLTWPQTEKWPVDGENDIFETLTGPTRTPLHTFIHYGKDNSQHHMKYDVDATQWQEMAMEWYPDAILIYLNGELVWTLTDRAAIPRVPHHICLQLDAFKKQMGDEPVHMYVDWVRIYQ
jgi:beta-glucanase (GH16 family)